MSPRHFVRVSESVENKLRLLFATQNALLSFEELSGRSLLETNAVEDAAVLGLWKGGGKLERGSGGLIGNLPIVY